MATAYAYREEPESSSEITAPKKNNKTGKTSTRRTTPPASRAATATKLEVETLAVAENQTEASMVSENTTSRGRISAAARAKAEAETIEKHRKWAEHMAELEAKRDQLIDRLDQGAAKIQIARNEGKDVSSWEDFWIQLLRSYEQICDDIRNLSLMQP